MPFLNELLAPIFLKPPSYLILSNKIPTDINPYGHRCRFET